MQGCHLLQGPALPGDGLLGTSALLEDTHACPWTQLSQSPTPLIPETLQPTFSALSLPPSVLLKSWGAGIEEGDDGGMVQGEAGRRAPEWLGADYWEPKKDPEKSDHPSNRVTEGGADSLTLPPLPLKAQAQTSHGGW